jgi:predicted porin
MKKIASTIIATSAFAAPTFAMDRATDISEMLASMPTIYGNIQLGYVSDNTNTTESKGLKDNLSTIGFKHNHTISEGVEAFFKAEFEYNGDNNEEGGGIDKLDEAYVGVKGEFGSIQIGSDDTVYEWADMVDTDEVYGLIDSEIAADQEGDNLQYVSPEIAEGLVIGVTVPFDSDSTFAGALAASYSTDDLDVVLAYSMGREEAGSEDGDTLALAGTYTIDDLSIIAQYETKSEGASGSKDGKDFLALQGMYTMGQNAFALGYGMTSYDATGLEDTSTIYVQALHNFSDQLYAYLEYTDSQDVRGEKDAERDILAIGAAYNF